MDIGVIEILKIKGIILLTLFQHLLGRLHTSGHYFKHSPIRSHD